MAVKPKLAMIPSGVGTDTLYSVLPTDGTGDFDFDRGGEATRINKDGLIETVSLGLPRLNYPLIDGVVSGCPSLLLEPESRNLIQYSEDFTQGWTANNSTVTSNQVISPDGTLNADKLVEDNTSNFHRVAQTITSTQDVVYSHTVFAKASERKYLVLRNNLSSNINACFDLEDGVVVYNGFNEANIEYYGNGWYRCFIKETATSTAGKSFSLLTSDVQVLDNNIPSYQGDGTSGLYVWGAMLEEQSYATSYIPNLTTGSTTRSAETCNNAGDVNTFNDSEGVLYFETKALQNGEVGRRISLSEGLGGSDNRLFFSYQPFASNFLVGISSGGSNLFQTDLSGSFDQTLNHKIAIKYSSMGCKVFINGLEEFSNAIDCRMTALNTVEFNSINSFPFYGNVKQLQYFDTALTDTDLEELTSWSSFNEMANALQYTII